MQVGRSGARSGVRLVSGRSARGFTLIELLIVVALIAIISAISLPNLLSARQQANESSAVATLRTVTSAQSQFKTANKADEDGDGAGEYGCFAELGGKLAPRGGAPKPPAELPFSLAMVTSNGEVSRSGYTMRIYLPEAGGVGHAEEPGGGVTPGVLDPNLAELTWVAYAWPSAYGGTGARTFFVSEAGAITHTDDASYTGAAAPTVQAGTALLTDDPTRMTARPAIGTRASDGNIWKQVQ
jgi:prepilin-type N-terminal cleavage/methylation domain-containing protein